MANDNVKNVAKNGLPFLIVSLICGYATDAIPIFFPDCSFSVFDSSFCNQNVKGFWWNVIYRSVIYNMLKPRKEKAKDHYG